MYAPVAYSRGTGETGIGKYVCLPESNAFWKLKCVKVEVQHNVPCYQENTLYNIDYLSQLFLRGLEDYREKVQRYSMFYDYLVLLYFVFPGVIKI